MFGFTFDPAVENRRLRVGAERRHHQELLRAGCLREIGQRQRIVVIDAPECRLRPGFSVGRAEAAEHVLRRNSRNGVEAFEIDDMLDQFRIADRQLASHQDFHP